MLSEIHKERLLEVARRIEENPEKFDITDWFGEDAFLGGVSPCNTTSCIAGEAAIMAYERKEIDDIRPQNLRAICDGKSYRRIPHWAGDYLGVPHTLKNAQETNHPLFYLESWIQPFKGDYESNENDIPKRAQIAAARIRHYVEHEE